jgi:hypothetical protein
MIIHVALLMVLAVVITTVTEKGIMSVAMIAMANASVAPKTFLKLSWGQGGSRGNRGGSERIGY